MGHDPLDAAYRLHADELVRFATAMVGPDDASDVVTDAMIELFHGPLELDRVINVRALLFRTVHRRVIDHRRATTRRAARELKYAGQHIISSTAPLESARAALMAVTMQQRTMVFLTYWCDMAPADVAVVVGVSEGSVRKQLARARARMRGVLGD